MMICKKFTEYILFMLMLTQTIVCCSITFEILNGENDNSSLTTVINLFGSSGPNDPNIIISNPLFTNLDMFIEGGNHQCSNSDTRLDLTLSGAYNDPVVIFSDFTCDTCNAPKWGCYKPVREPYIIQGCLGEGCSGSSFHYRCPCPEESIGEDGWCYVKGSSNFVRSNITHASRNMTKYSKTFDSESTHVKPITSNSVLNKRDSRPPQRIEISLLYGVLTTVITYLFYPDSQLWQLLPGRDNINWRAWLDSSTGRVTLNGRAENMLTRYGYHPEETPPSWASYSNDINANLELQLDLERGGGRFMLGAQTHRIPADQDNYVISYRGRDRTQPERRNLELVRVAVSNDYDAPPMPDDGNEDPHCASTSNDPPSDHDEL